VLPNSARFDAAQHALRHDEAGHRDWPDEMVNPPPLARHLLT
jgi:hypothetical protein